MRKLIFFGSIVLILYLSVSSKKYASKSTALDVEKTVTANDTRHIPAEATYVENKRTQAVIKQNNNISALYPANLGQAVEPKQDVNVSGDLKKNLQNSATAALFNEESDIEKRTKKFAQIVPEYGDYEKTPKILTGNSARVFSLFIPDDLFPELEIRDIRSAFANGIYPTRNIINALRLDDVFEGTIYIDYELKHKTVWSLQIDNVSNPVRGIFSLLVDDNEKCCKAIGYGPLKNVVLLASDPGTILVRSCDETFYMQLYRNGGGQLAGIYYERGDDGMYKAYKDHNLSFYRRSNK